MKTFCIFQTHRHGFLGINDFMLKLYEIPNDRRKKSLHSEWFLVGAICFSHQDILRIGKLHLIDLILRPHIKLVFGWMAIMRHLSKKNETPK